MRELTEQILRWQAAGTRFAVASIIGVTGSAPRPVGAAMAVDEYGTVVGSISGGCVEGAVYELCREALETGVPQRETFGYSDSDAFAVGLTCGGVLEVFVHPVGSRDHDALSAALRADGPAALVRDMSSGETLAVGPDWVAPSEVIGSDRNLLSNSVIEPDPAVVAHARAMLDQGATGVHVIGCGTREVTVFVELSVPPPRMIIFGAIDFAAAVARIGKFLGYHVTVCDARPLFATPARFPDADEVVVDWPHRYLQGTQVDSRTVICVLTHDAKFDIPVLEVALRRRVAYVGAMGSRRTHRDRTTRLRTAGLTESELSQLHSPMGLDLGGHTPEETAIAVAAEIVAIRHGGSGRQLRTTDTAIHHPAPGHTLSPPPMESAGNILIDN
ncbi:XdhC family protein [Nocardia macrotermitis]|uniref:Putative xanthine dehydrogenase subunit A n=1 Tax=Nocardia macrotermitis TaxID=2585198 RepID=A0A7K0D4E3_9NOCA|nr:XdhC/CoxI family protein [Nocardia macrotermitis]MQY20606.1 putative xanthine dehydrogenase subunit A [Nocardia macrotermitis]